MTYAPACKLCRDGTPSYFIHCQGCQARRAVAVGAYVKERAPKLPDASMPAPPPEPIDMVLFCPACGEQHIDAADSDVGELGNKPMPARRLTVKAWTNPPHRSHLCHGCGHVWRPADVPTNGVRATKSTGKDDSPLARPLRSSGRIV